MLRTSLNISKVWSKFTVNKGDTKIKLLIRDLPEDRIKDYLDFKLNHYVKYDILHEASGLLKNQAAVEEYSKHLIEYLTVHRQGVFICCKDEENDKPEIIAISAMKLKTLNDKICAFEKNGEITTKEVEKLYSTIRIMNDIYPISEQMKKNGIERFYDDTLGVGVHTDYRGLGICQRIAASRREICKEQNVPLLGAWFFSEASIKACKRDGWKTTFKITSKELEQRLGMTLKNSPKHVEYMVARINESLM